MRVGVHGTRGRMRGLVWHSIASLLLCSLACAPVAAQTSGHAAFSWRVDGCEQLPSAEVAGLLSLELTTQSDPAAASGEQAQPQVALRCSGLDARVSVMRSGSDAEPLELALDLAESKPEARARVLALAIAELIATSRLEQAQRGPTAAAPRSAARETPASVRLGLFLDAGATRVLEPAAYAPAVALGALQRWAAFSLQADVALELARVHSELGAVKARYLSVSLAPGWHLTGERLDLGLVLGVRAGHAQLSATAQAAGQHGLTLSGWVIMPIARAELELRVLPMLGVRLGVEAGYVVKPLRGLDADGQRWVAMRGLRAAALLGVSLWLDGL